jgi:hypothetical protein
MTEQPGPRLPDGTRRHPEDAGRIGRRLCRRQSAATCAWSPISTRPPPRSSTTPTRSPPEHPLLAGSPLALAGPVWRFGAVFFAGAGDDEFAWLEGAFRGDGGQFVTQ